MTGTIALIIFLLAIAAFAVWLGVGIARMNEAIERVRQERDEEI